MTLKSIAFKHAQKTANKLIELTHQAYPVVTKTSYIMTKDHLI